MFDSDRNGESPVAAAVLAAFLCCFAAPAYSADKEAELEKFSQYVDVALPVVAAMTGIEETEPVPIVMLTRAEVYEYVRTTVDREYPDGELEKRGRCLQVLGLLPPGYDLEAGFIDLITEEAGAFYDPHTDDL